MSELSPLFLTTLAQWGLPLQAAQQEKLRHYLVLLLTWNERLNLTAIRDPQQMQIRHFLDALSCVQVTGDLNGRSLIDVGAGAGFPGLPLKIAFPDLRLTLVESVGKKANFLTLVAAELELRDVTVLAERAEVVGQLPLHREQYDWAAARAVADLRVLLEYLLPLCRVGGSALAQKGTAAAQEVEMARAAIAILGGGTPVLHPVQLPQQEHLHYLVTIPKVKETPVSYPRRTGVPGKRPL